MKVLYYSGHPHINMAAPSGPGTHIREVVEALRVAGCEVETCIIGGETMAAQNAAIQFKTHKWKHWIPTWLWQSLKDIQLRRLDRESKARLREMITAERPDFVYERASYLLGGASELCAELGVPYMVEINAPYPEEKLAMEGWSMYQPMAKRIERSWLTKSKAVFTVSTAMAEYLKQNSMARMDHIHVVPNAVNENWLSIESDQNVIASPPEGPIVIGFVGSIFSYHGVDLLIQAAYQLQQKGQWACKFKIVGDGAILQVLKQLSVDLGVEHCVEFTGNVAHKEVINQIKNMDVCVMPKSNWYGSPVKIFEYGAMGKCIIAPDVIPV